MHVRGMSSRHQQQTCEALFRVRLGVRGYSLQSAGLVLSRSRISLAKTNAQGGGLFGVYEDEHAAAGAVGSEDSTVAEGKDGSFNRWLLREVPLNSINWLPGVTTYTTYTL